jgi:protease-4
VWDGGAARQMVLVDQFGGLEDALEWAAAKAGLKQGGWHPVFLGDEAANFDPLIRRLLTSEARAPATIAGGDPFALVARRQNELAARLMQDAERLMGGSGVQAYCLECPARPPAPAGTVRAPSGGMAALVRLLMAD